MEKKLQDQINKMKHLSVFTSQIASSMQHGE